MSLLLRSKLFIPLILFLISSRSLADGAIEIVDINNIPENVFVFGIYDIKTGELHLGVPKAFAHMRGFHFEFMSQISGVASPEAMIGKEGKGRYAGMGFIREGGYIYLHPLSSLKAAGKIEKIKTINPLLPKPNPVWSAMLPKDLAVKIFAKLALKSGLLLRIDNKITGSKRFEFNKKKHGSPWSPVVMGMVTTIRMASLYLKGMVKEINVRVMKKHLDQCTGPAK